MRWSLQVMAAFKVADTSFIPPDHLKLSELGAPASVVGEFQKDQPCHRGGVFARCEVGNGPQVVGRGPAVVFKLLELFRLHSVQCPCGCGSEVTEC